MRKKYDYFINNKEVARCDFIKELKRCCHKVIDTDVIAGWCGVDICEFDEKAFNRHMRSINNGVIVCFMDCRKDFYRKERKILKKDS